MLVAELGCVSWLRSATAAFKTRERHNCEQSSSSWEQQFTSNQIRAAPTWQIWLSLHQLPQAQKGASRAYPVLHRAAQWVNKPTWPSRPSCANAGSCFSPSCQAFGACFTTRAGRSTCHHTLKPGTFGGRSETEAATQAVLCHPPGVLLRRACSTWGQPG